MYLVGIIIVGRLGNRFCCWFDSEESFCGLDGTSPHGALEAGGS